MTSLNESSNSTALSLRIRLAAMMFLQYFMQGCYLPVASLYLQDALGFSERSVGVFFSAMAIGPLLAPLVVGQLVDRYFPTQRVVAVLHLIASVLMIWIYTQRDTTTIIVLATLYSILWTPTMMLTNALALHHLVRRDREFPGVRLWGTVGFVMAAWLIEGIWLQGITGDELRIARGVTFALSGATGIVMAVYCWLLPNTPPASQQTKSFAPGKALRMLLGTMPIFALVSFGIAVVHQFYFVCNSPFLKYVLSSGGITGAYEQRISSLGQISEVIVLALLGVALTRFGFKRVMLVGTLAYAGRCLIFASVAAADLPIGPSLVLVAIGNALHGLCFGAFLASAFMFVDRIAPPDVRGSMQTVYGTFILGSGFLAGGFIAGWVRTMFTSVIDGAKVADWFAIWTTCGLFALGCAALFALCVPRDPATRDTAVHT